MLKELFNPESIAVIGASRTKGNVGYEILSNLVKNGYTGKIIPVNPSADEICNIKVFKSLDEYKNGIDLSIIVIPAGFAKTAVMDSLKAGAKAIIIISAGFKEINHEGAERETEIARLCKMKNVRLLGPNCLGIINSHFNMNASFADYMPLKGDISVISQSGALCTVILDLACSRQLGLSKIISMGNKSDLSENDFLSYLAEDPETKVIVAYLESITSGKDFIKAAEYASLKKPVIIFKSGVTEAGGKAASSHTGSLAGADIAYGAAFKRSGIIRADTFEALFDYSMAFSMQPLPKGNNVAIITNAGGPGIIAADAVELSGMKVCALGSTSAAALKEKLPVAASVGNPIYVLGDADPERYVSAVKAAQEDNTVDAIIIILTPQAMTGPVETARAIAECAENKKPILVSFMGGLEVMKGRDELISLKLPDYPSPERAVNALKAMFNYYKWLNKPPRVLTRFLVNRRRVKRIIKRNVHSRRLQIGEAHAKAILKAYDINILPGQLVTSSEEAVEIAEKIGMPVAMKIASPDIIHKSDIGGVRLNLNSLEAVRDAFDLMMMRIKKQDPNADIEGVYLEKMCKRGREIILGMTRDPGFGPMLMFGLGGIFVEVMKDVAFHIAPITEDEAMQMLEQTRSYSLLKGVRGEKSVDIEAIAVNLQKVSQLVSDFPEIKELDINPFIVGKVGEESFAADARITLDSRECK